MTIAPSTARASLREKLSILTTIFSAVLAIISALAMQHNVRLVDIIALFAGGVGTGASIAVLIVSRRLRATQVPERVP